MSKAGRIIFWISFPLTAFFVGLLLTFYLDMSNGPLVIFILEFIAFVAMITVRIMYRNHRFWIRAIPTISFVLVSAMLLPFARPSIKEKSVAYYQNPSKTEVLQLENGKVQGLLSEDKKVEIYGGIPYAEAPIGDQIGRAHV